MDEPSEARGSEAGTARRIGTTGAWSGFVALLRSGNIHEEVIWACRVQDILDREVFVALHHTVEGFMQAVSAGLGIDPAVGFSHNREMAKMVKAWNREKKSTGSKNTKVDAVAKAHGEPISML